MNNIKEVTSVSGGRTSSYLALNYPTQYNIFSLVRIEDASCSPKDKKLIQYIEDKLQKPFIATLESDLTLYVLLQLEQELGREITWVSGDTFEQVIKNHAYALPNRTMRFCTSDMKMAPIFWWCYMNLFESEDDYIRMNVGYRVDEPNRKTNDFFDFVKSTKNFGLNYQNWVRDFEWRESRTPLKAFGIDNLMVKSFFANKPEYVFPVYSNCVGCFNKSEIELQEQFYYEPEKMAWFKWYESVTGNRFNMNFFLSELENIIFTPEQISMMQSKPTCDCTD